MVSRFVERARKWFFFIRNCRKYKHLGEGAFISRPLRLNGRKYISLMKNVVINEFAWLIAFKVDKNDPELIFGEGVQVEPVSHIAAVRRVVIDSDVYISSRVFISDNTHVFDDINTPIALQPIRFNSEVYIGKGSWIGQNVCIIGAKIGKNCFIMPNSVVLNDIPDYSVASGAPAVVVNIV